MDNIADAIVIPAGHLKYSITIKDGTMPWLTKHKMVAHWCDSNIGNFGETWIATKVKNAMLFQFSKEKDAVLFALKWA